MEEKKQLDRGSCEEDLLGKVDREKRGREKSAVGGRMSHTTAASYFL